MATKTWRHYNDSGGSVVKLISEMSEFTDRKKSSKDMDNEYEEVVRL